MMSFFIGEEERPILAMVKAESPTYTINNTSGQVVASVWVKW